MNQTKVTFVLLLVFFVCALAWGGRPGSDQGPNGRRMTNGGHQGGQENRGSRNSPGGNSNFDEFEGRNGRQSNGRQGNGNKYRSNLYNDDDVYGYDATYPNGEAAYINYRSKDARSRRGPEFARTSRAYSRQGAGSDRGNNFGQMSEYRGGAMW